MARMRTGPVVAALVVLASAWALGRRVADVRASDEPDPAWWNTRGRVTLVLTGGEAGAFQDIRGQAGLATELTRRLHQRGSAAARFVALGWHLRGGDARRDRIDAPHWRALFEAGGYVGSLLGAPECAVPDMTQPLGGLGTLGVPRRPLNVLLSQRNLASSAPPFLDLPVGASTIRLLTVLDGEDATALRDRGEALGQIAPATAFQNLSPLRNHLWVVATWPRTEHTLPALAGALSRLGPAVLVDVSGNAGTVRADEVRLGTGRPPLQVALGPDVAGVLDLTPERDGSWRATYRRVSRRPATARPSPSGTALDAVLAQRARAQQGAGLMADVPERDDPGARYVGSTACIACHTAIYKAWKRTPHAQALLHLRDVHAEWDPSCVACHVVGWTRGDAGSWARHASGFRDATTTGYLGGVGCESCHGPGSRHLMDPWNPALFEVGGPNRRGADPTACASCHDAGHDPAFGDDVAGHLQRAAHPRVPSDRRTVVPERLFERLRRAGLAPAR